MNSKTNGTARARWRLGLVAAVRRQLAHVLAHPRVPISVLGVVGLGIPTTMYLRPEPPPVRALGAGTLLPSALRIVDPSQDHADELGFGFRSAGFGIETYAPDGLRSSTDKGTWWITTSGQSFITVDDVRRLLATGSNVIVDGITPLTIELLGLECDQVDAPLDSASSAANVASPSSSSSSSSSSSPSSSSATSTSTTSTTTAPSSKSASSKRPDTAPSTTSTTSTTTSTSTTSTTAAPTTTTIPKDAKRRTVPCEADELFGTVVTSAAPEPTDTARDTNGTSQGPSWIAATTKNATMRKIPLVWDREMPLAKTRFAGTAIARTDTGHAALWMSEAGNLLWSMPSLSDGDGPQRLPFLPQELDERWGVGPRVERRGFDLYVDTDDYGKKTSPSKMAAIWERAGVRRVYVAAWKQNDASRWRYPYKKLVSAAHRRGIEVYAWVAWPHVDFSTWKKNPNCRERTGAGLVGKVTWRELVAITVPECFELAWKNTSRILKSAPFDGVNIVDLYFDSPYFGPRDASLYTPFHPTVRRDFKDKHGFDPITLLREGKGHWQQNPKRLGLWEKYRTEELTRVTKELLQRLRKDFPERSIVVTMMDDRVDPETGRLLAANSGRESTRVLALRRTADFELSLGDPVEFRSLNPIEVADAYHPNRPKEPIMMVSLAERFGVTHQTTERPTGLELFSTMHRLSRAAEVLSVFPAGWLALDDLEWLKFSLAGADPELRESGNEIRVSSDDAFILRLRGWADNISLDGRSLGAGATVDVPAGRHVIVVDRGGRDA